MHYELNMHNNNLFKIFLFFLLLFLWFFFVRCVERCIHYHSLHGIPTNVCAQDWRAEDCRKCRQKVPPNAGGSQSVLESPPDLRTQHNGRPAQYEDIHPHEVFHRLESTMIVITTDLHATQSWGMLAILELKNNKKKKWRASIKCHQGNDRDADQQGRGALARLITMPFPETTTKSHWQIVIDSVRAFEKWKRKTKHVVPALHKFDLFSFSIRLPVCSRLYYRNSLSLLLWFLCMPVVKVFMLHHGLTISSTDVLPPTTHVKVRQRSTRCWLFFLIFLQRNSC